jgi:thioredoxin reductase
MLQIGAMRAIGQTRRSVLKTTATVAVIALGSVPVRSMAMQVGHDSYDALVIGGSFAGLAAATQLARARRRVLVIDVGEPRNRFAAVSHGVPGHDGRSPREILALARDQLLAYPTAAVVSARAEAAGRVGDAFAVRLSDGRSVSGERVILATGVVDILPDIPGLAPLWGETVLQCPYCHGYELAERRFGVLMTGEPSLHQIKVVKDWSRDVVFLTNGPGRLTAEQRAEIEAGGVVIEEAEIASVLGRKALEGVQFRDGRVRELDALFLVTRTRFPYGLAEELGCELEEGPFGPLVKTDNLKGTTVAGVYAAGDMTRPIANVTLAMADGVMAGIFAHQSLLAHKNPYHRG